jgi:peptidylprolyl isomerase
MIRIVKILFCGLFCLSLFSIGIAQDNRFSDFLTTESGLKIKITQLGNGPMPVPGDKVAVHYIGKLLNDTVFDESYSRKQPFAFDMGMGQVIKGFEEGISLLHQNGKAILVIPPELGYGDKAQAKIPANSTLVFEIELVYLLPAPAPFKADGLDTISLPSKLKYIVVQEGKGEKVKKGRNVKIHYTGYFADGKIFDSSRSKSEPLKFNAGSGSILPGLDQAVMQMTQGSKHRVIIPPELGFGPKGNQNIPPNSTLIFDIELVEIMPEIVIKPFETTGKKVYTTESGLQYVIVKENAGGTKPEKGKTLWVHYTGYFADGAIFDSSVRRDDPLKVILGKGMVIKGWDEGLALMRQGEKFRFIIPPSLAYGDRQQGSIPANSTLTFDVELVRIDP